MHAFAAYSWRPILAGDVFGPDYFPIMDLSGLTFGICNLLLIQHSPSTLSYRMTGVAGLHLALGVASLFAAMYYHRRGRRAFHRFLMVWLALAIAVILIEEVFVRMNWRDTFLFQP